MLGSAVSDGIDWELVLQPEHPTGGFMVSIRSSVGPGPGMGKGVGRHLAGLVIGYLGSRDQRIVALFGAVSADFHHVRVELVDGSELVADIVDARDELGVNLYVAIPPTQPVRLVFTDALQNARFMEIQSASEFDYRH